MPLCGPPPGGAPAAARSASTCAWKASRQIQPAGTVREVHPGQAGVEPGRQEILRVAACWIVFVEQRLYTRPQVLSNRLFVDAHRRLLSIQIPASSATSRALLYQCVDPSLGRRAGGGLVLRLSIARRITPSAMMASFHNPSTCQYFSVADPARSAPGRSARARPGPGSLPARWRRSRPMFLAGLGPVREQVPMSANGIAERGQLPVQDADHRRRSRAR